MSCVSISSCPSIKRIGAALNFYSVCIKDNNDNVFSDINQSLITDYMISHGSIMDDYIHILVSHIDGSHEIFLEIYKYLISVVGKCDILQCNKFIRNGRLRDDKKEKIICENDDKYIITAYIDILDTIHCNLIHSFDTGLRINHDMIDIQQKEEDIMNIITKTIKEKNKIVSSIRGRDRTKINNKFVTTFAKKKTKCM